MESITEQNRECYGELNSAKVPMAQLVVCTPCCYTCRSLGSSLDGNKRKVQQDCLRESKEVRTHPIVCFRWYFGNFSQNCRISVAPNQMLGGDISVKIGHMHALEMWVRNVCCRDQTSVTRKAKQSKVFERKANQGFDNDAEDESAESQCFKPAAYMTMSYLQWWRKNNNNEQ